MRLRDFFRVITGRKTEAEIETEMQVLEGEWQRKKREAEEQKKKMLEEAKLQIIAQNPSVFGVTVGHHNTRAARWTNPATEEVAETPFDTGRLGSNPRCNVTKKPG